jgi:hypothetical protein
MTRRVVLLGIGGLSSPAVDVAAPPSAVCVGPQLPLKLHQAPDLGAVRSDVRLDASGQLAHGGQVDAEQLRAPLQRRRYWSVNRVVPGPHRGRGTRTQVRNRVKPGALPHFRDPEDVARYAEAFKQLLEVAATGEDSLVLLERMTTEIRGT